METWEQAQYRSAENDALEKRKAELLDMLNDADCDVELEVLRSEQSKLVEEFKRRNAEMELRNAKVAAVANGAGEVIKRSQTVKEPSLANVKNVEAVEDLYNTEEYSRAFYGAVTRKASMPEKFYRSDARTTVSDTKAVVPTTLMHKIIERMEVRGQIFAKVTKTNLKGGIEIPIMDLRPKANWVGEDEVSEKQKLTATEKIVFTWHELECALSQSRLASILTFEEFQSKFPEYVADAMLDALEQAILVGSGNGQPLGIIKDTRIKNVVTLNEDEISTWLGWHKNVKSKMPKAYRDGEFIMSQATFDTYIDGMVDANGQPVGRTNYGINGEESYRFIGKTVDTVEPSLIKDFDEASEGDVIAIYGRLSNYTLNYQKQLELNRWTDFDKRTENLGAYLVVDGRVVDPNGFMIIKKGKAAEASEAKTKSK